MTESKATGASVAARTWLSSGFHEYSKAAGKLLLVPNSYPPHCIWTTGCPSFHGNCTEAQEPSPLRWKHQSRNYVFQVGYLYAMSSPGAKGKKQNSGTVTKDSGDMPQVMPHLFSASPRFILIALFQAKTLVLPFEAGVHTEIGTHVPHLKEKSKSTAQVRDSRVASWHTPLPLQCWVAQ